MDTTQNDSITENSNPEVQQGDLEQQQILLEGTDKSTRPTLSEFKKSWGFRRTTIARREFMEEMTDIDTSPSPVRRSRGRRAKQTPQTAPDTQTTQRTTRSSKSVIDDLEWSAPSSPVLMDTETTPETSTGGTLDPSLWQDFGSAFHTAFSLLGAKECASTDMPDALAASDSLEANDDTEAPANEDKTDGMEAPDRLEAPAEVDIAEPIDIPITDIDIEESDNILVISSRDEDTEELTVMEIKETQASKRRQTDTRSRGVKGGRGKAKRKGRGRGRARGRGRGKGRGRGRATEPESSTADDEEDDDEVVFVSQTAQPQLPETEKESSPERGAAMEMSRSQSPLPITKCIILDNDLEQTAEGAPGQYDDAPQEKEEDKNTAYSSISDSEGYDPDALYCICRQKHNKRFMISCDSCQEWFHGDCVGVTEVQGRKMEKMGQEYICPCCVTKKHNQLQPNPQPQPEPDLRTSDTIQERLTPSPPGKEEEETEKQQASKEAVVEEKEAESKMQTDGSLPLCIGPGCPKHALPDSVYCGTDCILQHAALTMKSLSTPKEPKSRGRQQRKTATSKLTTKVQRSVKVSERSADQPEEECEEQRKGYGREEEATSPSACDPCLTAAQAPSKPSSNLSTALDKDSEEVKDKPEPVAPLNQSPEEPSTETSPSSEPVTELSPLVGSTQNKAKKSSKSDGALKKHTSPSSKHHETGALMVTKTSFVIPKKQLGPPPNTASACPSGSQPSSTPTLLNEPRNLPVSPAPIAPSSRPSQPNNQVRQSIQRSLTSILYKRVCDCDDLDVSESDVGKLVTSIEMEMFDIFRNTDSKYMNKYRTIMFNLKDPRNKGLLYRVMRGEISPFRLARMSQKDMQATKVPEPSPKQTAEAKDTAAKAPCLLQKPEAVKVDLPSLSLNPTRSDRNTEQKRNLLPVFKTRPHQPSQSSSMPDILSCVLKDTTSEHKAHLFDLKCKICTGQIPAAEEEEPVQKKAKVSESRDKRDYGQSCYTNTSECSWRGSAGDESPLRAPPDSPAMDSSTSSLMESSSCLIIDAPALTIVESPASPVQDSPASPILESPASPVMESPASPTSDSLTAKTQIRSYTPVMIPAVSTVTITRRDPRTAANRSSALSTDTSGPSNTIQNQPANYIPVQETSSSLPLPQPTSLPPPSVLPKSILMKPSSVDPRLYGASSRTINSHSPTDGETVQFLAKQDILWKGFLNMMSVAKFVTKAYLVSGSPENLKADLPDTIQIGGRIMPQTVWDYVARLKTSVTKELCVIRFHPATEEEEVAYVSLFSYFSSRGRFGVVANNNRSIKDVYLVPLSAKEAIPSKLLPLDGPGLEKNRPNLLLGLAITQKPKRPGNFQQEVEEKRPKVHMSKDPMWIPKPPVLYGSDKLEIFQPYDPETPISATCPSSPPSAGSPSDSSSSGSINAPSVLASTKATPPISTSVTVPSTLSTSKVPFDKNPPTTSGDSTPLQTILKTLFGSKPSDSEVTAASSSTINTVGAGKLQGPSQAPHPMVDPIVQQYGQKSKVKEIEEEENEYDRPYDPEEEYNPAMGYGMVASLSEEKIQTDNPAPSTFEEDDVAYDPEDDTIFEDIHTKSGTVVVSAATLTEQQRMLEELNKQIEEQKRQLKEQEEALRQQREAVGMFMAHFSVSDSLMSPPAKSLPLLTSQQTDVEQSRAEDTGSHQRHEVVETGTDVEALQKGHSSVPLLIPGGERKRTDTGGVKETGQSIELEIKGTIIESVAHDGTLVDSPDPEPQFVKPSSIGKSDLHNVEEDKDPAPNISSSVPNARSDRRGPGGPDFRGPGPDRRVLGMKGPGPDRRGPGGLDMEGSVPDRKGPRGPDFRGPVPERQGQHTECQGPNRAGGPDFTGPGPDRRGPGGPDLMGPSPAERGSGGPDFMGLRPDRRGPGGPDFIGPGPERRGPGCPDFMGPGPDRRGPGVLDYTGPGLERQGQHTEGPGLHRKGGPDFMRPQPDTRGPKGPDFVGPGQDRRGPGGPDFMGPGTDRRGPGVSDYTGPGPERQCQLTEGPGPHRTGGPNFMGPWPDRRGPGGPDIRGPGPGRRGPDTEGPGPTGRDPLGPNPMGSDPDRGESDMECPGPNRQGPDFVGPGPGRRGSGGPDFMGPGPNRRRPGDPDLRGPRPDRGGHGVPNFSGLGPERSGPGGPDFRATGPDRRELEGPAGRGPGPERIIPDIEGPRPYRRGSRGPDFKDPGIKRGTNLEGPVNNRRGPQEEWGIEEFDGLGPIWDQGQRPHSAGPGNEWRGPDFRTIGLERRGPEFRGSGLNIREGRKMRGPGPEISSPNTGDEWAEQGFRGPEPDRRGPVMEGQWSDRGRANMEGPESERQGPGDEYRRPGFMGPGPIFRGPDMEGPGHCRRGPGDEWRGPDRGCPEPDRWGPGPNFRRERHPNMGEPGLDRTGLDMRGPGPGEGQRQLDCRGPGPNRRVQNMEAQRSDEKDHRMGGDWKGFDRECQDPDRLGPDFRHNTRGPNIEGPRPDSRGSDFRNPQSNRRSSDMEAPGLERKCFGGSDYRGPGSDRRGPGVRNEWSGPDSRGPGPDRRGPDFRGLGSERSGPEIECPGPGRRGLEPDFREEGRDPEVRGPRPEQDDWRGLDLRGLGPEWRHLSRDGPRPERRDPYMEAARSDSKGQDMMGPKMDTRGHEPDFIKDMQESDFRGPGSVTRGKEPRLRGRMIGNERKGPDNREPDSKHSDVLTSPHFNNPRMPSHNQSSSEFQTGQQATRFQGPGGPHSSPFSRPMGPTSDMGGQPRLHFDSPNIPPTVRPLKHKAPLLPTPTEGLIRLPNRIINSHDVPNKKQQKSNSPDSHGREWNRVTSRPASRERDLDKEVGRQEQGQTSGGHGSTPVGVSAGLVEVNKKEDNEVDKHKGHSPCEISKTSQTTINIGQPEREPKEKQAKNDNSDIPQD
ncbi:death-inducer obliterator 1-like [Lampris incognitus]|uniref:death-inducer obliterator 1-like n=1 Tax=Lampris incognitus TaxID=2546036 RepID=UPI0024B5D7B3|nr:death-inducer obliterator 1-like [Lampris incognitus]